MPNPEHLKILKKGVEVWNRWRDEDPDIEPDLQKASLRGADLRGAFLNYANLQSADLQAADLRAARFQFANLQEANLKDAKIQGADLLSAHLRGAHLQAADLQYACLRDADLQSADLQGANLRGADLLLADLKSADCRGSRLWEAYVLEAQLQDADLSKAKLGQTVLGHLDLREVKGLKDVQHSLPSMIATSVLVKSRGRIPIAFLRGCGLSDWEIEAVRLHDPELSADELTDITDEIYRLKGESPIQVNPLFISYSHVDTLFVETLEERFEEKRIRYWRDVHDMKAGRMERQIDIAIRQNPTVLLILSEHSIESDWVEWEVSKARDIEKELKRDVLCPVALDDAWKTCDWPGPLRRQIEDYHILNFSGWQDDAAMERQFQKLIDGLGLFYPKAARE